MPLEEPHIDPEDEQVCLGHRETPEDYQGSVMPPLVQSSLFIQEKFDDLVSGLAQEHQKPMYSRGQNPTVADLEKKLAKLENGEACKCFSSGMAAVSSVFLAFLKAGDHVLFINHIYGPTLQLAQHLKRFNIESTLLEPENWDRWAEACLPHTKMIYFESPGTMLFHTVPIDKIVARAKSRDILTVIDNTWASPLFQKPLNLGVDLAVHSATKYIGGHSDVVAGAVIGAKRWIEPLFYRAFLLNGGCLGPFDAWLLIRGLRTLPVRMRRHHRDGLAVARFLADHARVARVFHPAFERGYTRANHCTGYSGLFSFQLKDGDFEQVSTVINRLKLFRIGVSWGGAESIVLSPDRPELSRGNYPSGLIRISVGLEGASPLMADLQQALAV